MAHWNTKQRADDKRGARIWTEEEKSKVRVSSMRHFQLNNKEWLFKQYVELKRTTTDIAKEIGCANSTVFFTLNRLNIPRRTRSQARIGIKLSAEHLANMKIANRKKAKKGADHHMWKGGQYTGEARKTWQWKEWRAKVYAQDNYTCRGCGMTGKKKNTFHPHHILPVRDFPHLMYSVDNGITLCIECHEKTMMKEYRYVAIFRELRKDGELLGNLDQVISSQDEAGMPHKVQRLEDESRSDSISSTSAVHQ